MSICLLSVSDDNALINCNNHVCVPPSTFFMFLMIYLFHFALYVQLDQLNVT